MSRKESLNERTETTWKPVISQTGHQRIARHLRIPSFVVWISLLLIYSAWVDFGRAYSTEYCSSMNTASGPANFSIWQSELLCGDFCTPTHAFAIVQWQNCWCSDYIPEEQLDLSACAGPCPGFKTDLCGNLDTNKFGYVSLSLIAPSGTFGATPNPSSTVRSTENEPSSTSNPSPTSEPSPTNNSSPTDDPPSTSTPTPTTTSEPAPIIAPVTSTLFISTSSVIISSVVVQVPTTVTVQPTRETVSSSSADAPTTSTPLDSSTTSSSTLAPITSDTTITTPLSTTPMTTPETTPIPVLQISVTTIVGRPQTITITPSSPNEGQQTSPVTTPTPTSVTIVASKNDNFFSNTGRAAAIFTLIALALVAFIGACLWACFRKKKRDSMLLDGNMVESGGRRTPGSPAISSRTGSGIRKMRSISSLGLSAAFGSEKGYSATNTSQPMPTYPPGAQQTPERLTDQRLDPNQVWMRFENENSSRVSIRSLRDDQDYSRRVLKVLNPDD